MNVLYANESFAPQFDGVAICAQSYADIINKKYGKSYVLTAAHKERKEKDFEYEIFQCPTSKITIANQYKVCLPMPLKLKNEIDRLPLDLVHSHCPFITGILAMRIAKQNNVPHISTFHSKYKDDVNLRTKVNFDLPGEMVAKYAASFYNKCDYVWTVNQGTAKTLREYGYKGDVTIMPNGCDMPVTYRNARDRKELAHKYGIDPSLPILLFVGRLTYLKNVDLIVESLCALKKHGKNFSMLMVGSGEDEAKLKKLVQRLNLEDVIKFTGKVLDRKELRKIYSSSDLFVFPSMYDNAPLVVREAAACGVPSLLLKGSNSAEGITDGESGILAYENVEDISLSINDALTNIDLKLMGENARRTIYISWEDVVERAAAEYEKIMADYAKKQYGQKNKLLSLYDIDLEKDFDVNLVPKITRSPKKTKNKK